MSGKVVKVSGPLVVATGLSDANMSDVVRVGPQRLIGEILTMKGDSASIRGNHRSTDERRTWPRYDRGHL